MTFANRVKTARKHAKLTQKELADRLGLSQTAVHKLESGFSASSRKTVGIALTCGVDPIWLQNGDGTMTLHGYAPETTDQDDATQYMSQMARTPLISWQEMEQACPFDTPNPENIQSWVPVVVKNNNNANAFALQVPDDSMEPKFSEGETLLLVPSREVRHGAFVVARTGETITFKQLIIMGSKKYLKPVNQRYPLVEVQEEIAICGIVVSKYKDYS